MARRTDRLDRAPRLFGTDDPTPQVIAESTPVDLWANGSCVTQETGPLTWQGGYADYNGNAYIRCRLLSWRAGIGALAPGLPGANNNSLTCKAGGARLDTGLNRPARTGQRRLRATGSKRSPTMCISATAQLRAPIYAASLGRLGLIRGVRIRRACRL